MANRTALGREILRLEEDVLYSEKSHFSIATVWSRLNYLLGGFSALAAAMAGIMATTNPTSTSILAILSAVLTGLMTFLDPPKQGQQHHAAGIRYNGLRGELRRFRELALPVADTDDKALQAVVEALAQKKQDLMLTSPHIGGLAYNLGRRSIERREQAYEVDKEKPDQGQTERPPV